MSFSYPTSLDTAVGPGPSSGNRATTATNDATFPHGGSHADISGSIVALENMVGITNSTVTSSHEYRIRRQPWTVWSANDGLPSASGYATWSPVNSTPYLSFAQSVVSTTVFKWKVPWGAVLTGGVVIRLQWCSATATTGNVFWGVAIENFGVATVVSDHFDTQTTAAATVGGTVSITTETDITETNNTLAAGQDFRLQVQRVGTSGSDTMVGAAQLFTVSIESAT